MVSCLKNDCIKNSGRTAIVHVLTVCVLRGIVLKHGERSRDCGCNSHIREILGRHGGDKVSEILEVCGEVQGMEDLEAVKELLPMEMAVLCCPPAVQVASSN